MTNKVIIYTGAPASSALDWSPAGLVADFDEPIARFARLGGSESASVSVSVSADPGVISQPRAPSSAPNHAVWRSLPLEPTPARVVGFSQQFMGTAAYDAAPVPAPVGGFADFFTSAAVSFTTTTLTGEPPDISSQEQEDMDTQFYATSLAAHDQDIPASRLIAAEESQITAANTSFTTTTTSFDETTSSLIQTDNDGPVKPPLQLPPGPGAADRINNLSDIPTARHLVSIRPQTMTINLIVGIISVSPTRTITARRNKKPLHHPKIPSTHRLIEVLVGDETRAGFAVTFWLAASGDNDKDETTLTNLRTGDIVLLQNVALNVFRDKVYGSSLRRNLTRVYLLFRVSRHLDYPGDDGDGGGGYYTPADLGRAAAAAAAANTMTHPQLDKTRRVREWVVRFVGHGNGNGSRKTADAIEGEEGEESTKRRRAWDSMPPIHETQ
ncbi:hypothetical protein QBC47DRAFT_372306 [Echria macrotheca]|uniref:Nucleic acid-binding, OB-fold protein n=1 Tax=Echria macrotheca TaxID=438768 RepID=A0AAJ0BKC2_9PEZI|nr:hypothetical protein QBC47DRAFT_372306 [Echria macrotheca]